jgi:1-deoxy-D-xylulose-5-phosphate reductoisomerase
MNADQRRGVAVLGSTGSIGTSTLDVLAALADRFRVVALAANRNVTLLQEQIDRFKVRYACTGRNPAPLRDVTVVTGTDRLTKLALLDEVDIVVVATTGHEAIVPTIEALRAGKVVALANKESIVAAGELVMPIARAHPGCLRPVDSEHSALWQCLTAGTAPMTQVRRLVLTASGGPFRGWNRDQLSTVTPADALRHPTWDMGAKITIDSATLMNKGLEVIEAHWLFDCPLDQIDVVVHPQSLVHSCVEFVDGSLLAQIASHDMRVPIQYALTFPERVSGPGSRLNILELGRLDFERPDHATFPLLNLAREAARRGSTYPTVLSATDAVAVHAFLQGRIAFTAISDVIRDVLDSHVPQGGTLDVESILAADRWAASTAERWLAAHT